MICYAAALLLTLLPLHHFYHHGLKSRHRQFSSIHRSSDEQAEQQQQVHTSFTPNISSSNSRQLSCILHISISIYTKCSERCWYNDDAREKQTIYEIATWSFSDFSAAFLPLFTYVRQIIVVLCVSYVDNERDNTAWRWWWWWRWQVRGRASEEVEEMENLRT